jgi:hypothetical protein
VLDGAATSTTPKTGAAKGNQDMLPYTYTVAAAAAVLAATAIAGWNRNGAEVPEPAIQVGRSHQGPADINAEAVYLPALFDDEERAARIEPLPPQF